MSSSLRLQASSSSTPAFQATFQQALEEYKKRTGDDPTAHPLAAEISGCDSPDAILTVLEGKANGLKQSRSADDRLTKWLIPTVTALYALSATPDEGAELPEPSCLITCPFPYVDSKTLSPTKIIFSAINILLVAAKGTGPNHDALVKLFARFEIFFDRLKIYIPPSSAVTNGFATIMAEVLSILGIATKGIKERRSKKFLKTGAGTNDLKDALQRFGELEERDFLTGIAQISSDPSVLIDVAKELKAETREMKAMLKDIVVKMGARDWQGVLQKLKEWLSPPDPSTNYNIGLCDLHEETATWFLDGPIFQEWYSTGSFLWIDGKCAFVETFCLLSLTAPAFNSGLGEEHFLLRNHPAYPVTIQRRRNLCGIFLF
ncbi:hypothetical protein EI94DRAFT_954120 [Lactarius quietus]|nr:hypothetical protein EI94DRAFT_954120 [Lactarius quietus]